MDHLLSRVANSNVQLVLGDDVLWACDLFLKLVLFCVDYQMLCAYLVNCSIFRRGNKYSHILV